MFDAHCHFPFEDSLFCTSTLLPQNIVFPVDLSLCRTSEVGLDKRYENLLPFEKQQNILQNIFSYAKENKVCLTLHCVRRTKVMLDLLKLFKFKPKTVIWHGFNGSFQTAEELYKLGLIISAGPSFNKSIKDLFNANPFSVFETDYTGTDPAEHSAILKTVYQKAAEELKTEVCELDKRCKATASEIIKARSEGTR